MKRLISVTEFAVCLFGVAVIVSLMGALIVMTANVSSRETKSSHFAVSLKGTL